MKICSIWSRKGGAGKTTLALSLAGLAINKGLNVMLIDDDPQGSASWMANRGKLPFEVTSGWPTNRPDGIDLVIVDYPPRTDDTPAGDVVVIPYQPTALDFSAVSQFIPRLAEKKHVVEVVNRLDQRLREPTVFAQERKQQAGAFLVSNRSAYQRAISDGVTVFDESFNNISGSREARREIEAIFVEIMK